MHTALIVGAAVAFVSGPLGVFTVLRGQAFAGEAMGDIGTTGGSGAFLVGVGPLWGFLVFNIVAAALMELAGVQRRRGRELAIGVVLGAALGVAALLLYLDSTMRNTSGVAQTVLFGSVFEVADSTIPLVAALAAIEVAIVATIARPLLLASTSPELAAARGIPVALVGWAYLVALAVSVALCSVTIGAILSTALLIGPAAAALRIARGPVGAVLWAGAIGVAVTCVGILISYDSFEWSPGHHWPVSFCVVALVVLVYVVAAAVRWPGRRRRGRAVERASEPGPLATLGG